MIQLKEIDYRSIEWFHKLNTMPEIKKWINNCPDHWELDETLNWFYEYNKKRMFENNNIEYIFIARNENYEKVGYTQLLHHDILNNKAEVGIMVHPKFQGKNCGRKMLKQTIKIAFHELNIHKVYSTIREDNEASLGLFKSIGFTEDGILKDEIYDSEKYWDFMVLSYISDR